MRFHPAACVASRVLADADGAPRTGINPVGPAMDCINVLCVWPCRTSSAPARPSTPRTSRRSDRCLRSEQASSVIGRSEEHTSELQSLMRISYAVFCLKKKQEKKQPQHNNI